MFDIALRPLKDNVLDPVARLVGRIMSPNAVTLLSLLLGIASALVLWYGAIGWAFLLWILNRVTDGLDGAVARVTGRTSDLGGYLDIVTDFVVYSALPIAFVLRSGPGGIGGLGGAALAEAAFEPPYLIPAALVLLAAFYVNAASWMHLSAILEKRGRERGGELTSVTMPEGIIGGTETVGFFTLFFLLPMFLAQLFWIMALLTLVSALQRVVWAVRKL
jgi:phosphatidylglycerophosphate synthase